MLTTYSAIAKNKRESWLLIICFLVVVSALGFFFSQWYNNYGIFVFAVIFSVLSAFFSYFFADSITLGVSKAQEISRESSPELFRLVENLTIAAGLPVPRIYIIDDPSPNAFATGRDPKHAVVCVTTGILAKLEKPELEGVIAHELSHIGNYDIRLMMLVAVLVGSVTLISHYLLRSMFWGGPRRRDNNNEGGQIAMIFAVVGLILAILAPLIATLIKLAVSRQREYLADASGALLTRYPEGLARALEKISTNQPPLQSANNATAHLFIVNPLTGGEDVVAAQQSGKKVGWLAGLFNTHPPIEDRVKRLREMNI